MSKPPSDSRASRTSRGQVRLDVWLDKDTRDILAICSRDMGMSETSTVRHAIGLLALLRKVLASPPKHPAPRAFRTSLPKGKT